MSGILFSLLAGMLMSLQGVFNSRTSEKIGLWETNVVVQGTGLVFTLIILFFAGNGNLRKIKEVNLLYLTGGIIGVLIIYTVMLGILRLGPAHSISIILIAQLITATLIDMLGLFDTQKLPFHYSKLIGVGLMIAGIIVFKLKG